MGGEVLVRALRLFIIKHPLNALTLLKNALTPLITVCALFLR